MPEWLTYLLGAAVTLSLGYLTVTASRRTSDRDRIASLEKRQDFYEGRLGKSDDYIQELRQHITDGKAPPPPPYPPGFFD